MNALHLNEWVRVVAAKRDSCLERITEAKEALADVFMPQVVEAVRSLEEAEKVLKGWKDPTIANKFSKL